jgi:hypothetical protein
MRTLRFAAAAFVVPLSVVGIQAASAGDGPDRRSPVTASVQIGVQWGAPYRDGPRGPGFDRYRAVVFDDGFNDGYREGFDAGRHRRRYEPQRERRYRDAGRGYRADHGGYDYVRHEYRRGFLAGYERGYREGRDSRYRRRGWGW